MVGNIPEDIVTEILVRVPVKSLGRCKSVCMAWLSIISDPYFIKYHLSRANKNPRLLIIQKPTSVAPSKIITCDENFDRVVMPSLFYPDHRVVSCYNGIVCLKNMCGDAVYLWNPLIRQFKKLAPPPKRSSFRHIFEFGYDSISDDYKVLRILWDESDDLVPMVQVYSTNASCWREFPAPILKKLELSCRTCTTNIVNNVLYFFIEKTVKIVLSDLHEEVFGNENKLVSFDLHEEVFGLVPLPNFMKKGIMRSNLLDFHGSVAMIIQCIGDDGPEVNLWTLDDVFGPMSWTKHFSIDHDGFIRICCYVGAGQFQGVKCNSGSYLFQDILYDHEKRETIHCMLTEDQKDIVYDYEKGETINRELTLDQNVCATEKYTQTLVSMDGYQQVE